MLHLVLAIDLLLFSAPVPKRQLCMVYLILVLGHLLMLTGREIVTIKKHSEGGIALGMA